MNTIKLNTVGLDSKLIVKKESGGGESESGDSYNIEYLDVYALDDSLRMSLVTYSFMLRWKNYTSSPESSGAAGSIYAIMIDLTTPINLGGGLVYSTKTILEMGLGITEEQLAPIPRITREQFFDPDWRPLGYEG